MSRKEELNRTQVGIYKEETGGLGVWVVRALFFFHSGFTHMCAQTQFLQ